MAGQVMEAPAMHQQVSMLLGQLQASCKTDHHLAVTTSTTTASRNSSAAATAAEMTYLQQLQTAAAAAEANNGNNNGGARGEQCPRCASHDTKFCYYNNYNTSQPRHFCRSCRRYWTLGGSLRNVPIGGSTRKRPRLAHPATLPASRRHPAHVVFGGGAPAATVSPPAPPQGLLGSLFALGAAPLLEGRGEAGFDLGLGLTMPAGAGELGVQMQGLGLRGGLGGMSPLLWPAGLLDNDHSLDAWKVPGVGAAAAGAAMWPEFSAATPPPQAGGLLPGGTQLM